MHFAQVLFTDSCKTHTHNMQILIADCMFPKYAYRSIYLQNDRAFNSSSSEHLIPLFRYFLTETRTQRRNLGEIRKMSSFVTIELEYLGRFRPSEQIFYRNEPLGVPATSWWVFLSLMYHAFIKSALYHFVLVLFWMRSSAKKSPLFFIVSSRHIHNVSPSYYWKFWNLFRLLELMMRLL